MLTIVDQQIKWWLVYQYMKDQDINPTKSGAQNLYQILLHQLTGMTIQKPYKIWVINIWQKTQHKEINRKAKIITKREKTPLSKLATVCDKVAHEHFEKLPEVEQKEWVEQANEEHEAAIAKWKEETEGNPSIAPVDCQRWLLFLPFLLYWNSALFRCIQGLI